MAEEIRRQFGRDGIKELTGKKYVLMRTAAFHIWVHEICVGRQVN
jgi:hypothetical protein